MKRAGLAATIKARWICEQAHQQLKEKLGLDHFEGRSWQGLHRHALMTMIAYAFLQHRHLTQVGRKKESTDRRLSLACRPYATPSSISFFDHYLSNASSIAFGFKRERSLLASRLSCASPAVSASRTGGPLVSTSA